ncbi:MAG: M28 family peptidase [Gemmatimonadales bacterium]|nr:M28 family peptidase [Gemmatimonadales bacterium]NIN10018.1 M28 family peptidase [Gemmatimonadales bacterium]NIQ98670.1 M28 family peptidase [Gemmatimonadales bacterium]NIS63547.1 M28 family peptidase [Gemmatimonadales bacterium]
MSRTAALSLVAAGAICLAGSPLNAQSDDVSRLVAALLGDTPLIEDARALTDEIGGRPTGSPANLAAVEWALARFRSADVAARREAFTMPALWLERSASATVSGEGISFPPRVAAMPFAAATGAPGVTAPLVDAGRGTAEDFRRLGARARGAFVLIETDELADIEGLFREYTDAAGIEGRAFDAGVAGVVYMGSRPNNLLYRHNASLGPANQHRLLVMERDAASRILRLLRGGTALTLTAHLDIESGGSYESYNVVGEITGSTKPDEIVVIGAHLDSWDLGTGALDNGANVAMVIDMARQIRRLGLQPARTIRFVLFNGEEQGLIGSWKYTVAHLDEMDEHVLASSFDIGTGRIVGFFTGGRPEIVDAVEQVLEPVRGLGPFQQLDVPIVGTDNFDFMMQGVANIVAIQEPANYGPNYHARSDTFDKVDQHQLRLNGAIAAAVIYGFATMDVTWKRQTRAEIEALVAATDLEQQMRTFGIWESWAEGRRGRVRR